RRQFGLRPILECGKVPAVQTRYRRLDERDFPHPVQGRATPHVQRAGQVAGHGARLVTLPELLAGLYLVLEAERVEFGGLSLDDVSAIEMTDPLACGREQSPQGGHVDLDVLSCRPRRGILP